MVFVRQDLPLGKIREKRVLVLIDPSVEKAARNLAVLQGKGARLVIATHVSGMTGGAAESLRLNWPRNSPKPGVVA
jgi:hypothetical protein